ncbi:MAG: helix-turn-helix transcriptional regulator [Pseudomonadota bacterium]
MARLRFQVWLDIREMQAEDLARRVGVSNQAVDRWLKHGIPQARVAKVAKALDIEPSELYRFVDADLSSELIDYAQNVGRKKRGLLRRREVDTTAANSAGTESEPLDSGTLAVHVPEVCAAPDDKIFADRRRVVDRRRRQSLAIGTPSRRKNLDRRDTSYRNTYSDQWWLKVDYLDGKVKPTPVQYCATTSDNLDIGDAEHEPKSQLTGTDAD